MIFSNISEILNECPSELDCNQRNSFENKVVTWLKGDMDDDEEGWDLSGRSFPNMEMEEVFQNQMEEKGKG